MRRLFMCTLVTVIISSFGCSISGRVTHEETGLEGISVTLGGQASKSRTTDGEGRYKFAQLYAGAYTVTPSSDSYYFTPNEKQITIPLSIWGGNQRGVDFKAHLKSPVTAVGLGNGTVSDIDYDGVFEGFNAASILEVRSTRISYLNRFVTKRAIMEFDISVIPAGARIQSAILELTFGSVGFAGDGFQMDFYGYVGDGQADLADRDSGDRIVATMIVDGQHVKSVGLTDYIQSLVDDGHEILGLNIRAHSESATASTDDHCTFGGFQSTGLTYLPPKLTIQF